jgi:uncharacterized protein
MIDTMHYTLDGLPGVMVWFVLGLVGGGSSMLAVPLLHVLFALLMIVIAVLMFRGRSDVGTEGARCNRDNVGKVAGYGSGAGVFSGFFGICGGFLIVPCVVTSTFMNIVRALGSSLHPWWSDGQHRGHAGLS